MEARSADHLDQPRHEPSARYGGPGSPANYYTFTLYALDNDDLSGEIAVGEE